MDSYSTYIFDLDGTLLDTLDDLAIAVNTALRQYGMPEHSREAIRGFVGNGVRLLMIRAIENGAENPFFDDVFQAFCNYYSAHSMDHTRPYEGVMEVLARLRSQGKRIAVVSNKFHTATVSLCRYFFGDTVEVAIGEHESEGIRKKPAPDTVVEALKQLGVTADGAVYVGDSDVDVMTARNAGLPCVSVLWGFRDKAFLVAHGASTFIEHPNELIQTI